MKPLFCVDFLHACSTDAPGLRCKVHHPDFLAPPPLAGAYVENLPWLKCSEKYDRPHTFHYMDPPYFETEGYGADFGLDQYQAMADFMRRCEGKVMVSLNDHPVIREVFAGFRLQELTTNYTTTNQRTAAAKKAAELVIMNWPVQNK